MSNYSIKKHKIYIFIQKSEIFIQITATRVTP